MGYGCIRGSEGKELVVMMKNPQQVELTHGSISSTELQLNIRSKNSWNLLLIMKIVHYQNTKPLRGILQFWVGYHIWPNKLAE